MERSFKKEVQALQAGRRRDLPRRRHPRRHQGAAAVGRVLCRRLSGRAGVASARRPGRRRGHHGRARRASGDLLQRSLAPPPCSAPRSTIRLRGAVTWKSIVGTNVAADALSNLSSPGVIGGAMIILGEDYGEGASVIQERSYAYALKSSMWLLDPRPDLPSIVRTVEKGFELSEASHAPVMLELRIRACHATGEFAAKDNRKGVVSGLDKLAGPPRFEYGAAGASAGDLHAGEAEGRGAPAGGARIHPRAQAQRDDRRRSRRTSASSSWAG